MKVKWEVSVRLQSSAVARIAVSAIAGLLLGAAIGLPAAFLVVFLRLPFPPGITLSNVALTPGVVTVSLCAIAGLTLGFLLGIIRSFRSTS